jgi:hypothetical protein
VGDVGAVLGGDAGNGHGSHQDGTGLVAPVTPVEERLQLGDHRLQVDLPPGHVVDHVYRHETAVGQIPHDLLPHVEGDGGILAAVHDRGGHPHGGCDPVGIEEEGGVEDGPQHGR